MTHFRVLDCTGWCDQGNILKIITSFLRAPTGCRARKHGQSVPQRDVHDSVEFCEHQHHECSRFAASERSTILWVSLDMDLFLSLVIILKFTLEGTSLKPKKTIGATTVATSTSILYARPSTFCTLSAPPRWHQRRPFASTWAASTAIGAAARASQTRTNGRRWPLIAMRANSSRRTTTTT